MKVKRRFPNYFTGFEETEHEVNDYQDLISIDWIKDLNTHPTSMGMYYSPNERGGPDYLMHLFKGKDKVLYFVVGYIFGNGEDLGLTDYNKIIERKK